MHRPIEYEQVELDECKPIKPVSRKVHKRSVRAEAMTFQQLREYQRVAEKSHLGPGSYQGVSEFSSSKKGVLIKPEQKLLPRPVESTPGPGMYDTLRGHNFIAPKLAETKIVKPQQLWIRPADHSPEPGSYQKGDLNFGKDAKSFKIVTPRMITRPESAKNLSLSRSCFISTPLNVFIESKRDITPDPGQYDKHIKEFGATTKPVKMNQKERDPLWKANENPGPGMYDSFVADSVTKQRVLGAKITEPLKLYERPRETTPDPGQY